MSEQEFECEMRYQVAIQMAKSLLKSGAVSEEEYRQIDTILLEKYHPIFGTLFSDTRLINLKK